MRHPSARSTEEFKLEEGRLKVMKRKITSVKESKSGPMPFFLWFIMTTACFTGITKLVEETLGCLETTFIVEKYPV